ncbi:MAG: response regulator [Candidatus Omnitrophica bacterium]|nr:response regulator [Candidatus Omnitrophota bacterium]
MVDVPQDKNLDGNTQADSSLPGAGKRALVIDDDPTTLTLLAHLLGKFGFSVETALTGQEGWDKVSDSGLDIIITEVFTPDLGGFEFLKELKQNEDINHIPVIIISSRKSMRDTFMVMGADDFIPKPINSDDLRQKITLALKKNKGQGSRS